jgi:hypothetical protein
VTNQVGARCQARDRFYPQFATDIAAAVVLVALPPWRANADTGRRRRALMPITRTPSVAPTAARIAADALPSGLVDGVATEPLVAGRPRGRRGGPRASC